MRSDAQPDAQQPINEFDTSKCWPHAYIALGFSQIDKKLTNMMHFMSKFITSLPNQQATATITASQTLQPDSNVQSSPTIADISR
jgi:hypothetical protein